MSQVVERPVKSRTSCRMTSGPRRLRTAWMRGVEDWGLQDVRRERIVMGAGIFE
jgi:hypothetical protein